MPLSQYTHVLTQWKIHRRAIKEEIVNTLTDMIEQATSAVKQGLSFKVSSNNKNLFVALMCRDRTYFI